MLRHLKFFQFFLWLSLSTLVLAQNVGINNSLQLRGEISFWNQGEASLRAAPLGQAAIDANGQFSLLLNQPNANSLKEVKFYNGVECLKTSNLASRYLARESFEIFNDRGIMAKLYLQSPKFDFRLGDSYQEFHYYSEETTLSGGCIIPTFDGGHHIYIFPDLLMVKGWNRLLGTISEVDGSTKIFTFSVASEEGLLWELETSSSALGIQIGYNDSRDLIIQSILNPNSPAKLAGLQAGDIIQNLDGLDASQMNIGMAILNLRRGVDLTASFEILRNGELVSLEVLRDRIIAGK